MNVPPIMPSAAALRAQIIGAAEAELMAVVGEMLDVPAPHAETASAPDPVRQAANSAKATAAGQQGSLAPLLADLAQAQSASALTPAIKAAISQVLALRTPLDGPITGDVVEKAVAQSGLFLEAHLAAATPTQGTVTPDLKAALLTLGRALAAEPVEDVAPQSGPIPSPGRSAAPTPSPAALPQSPDRSAIVPGRGVAIPPILTALPRSADLPAIVQYLRPQVDQAVARQVLLQPVYAPDEPAIPVAPKAAAGPQGDLTPLLADLEQAQAAPNLTAPIKTAIRQVLAVLPPQDELFPAEIVEPAIAEGGRPVELPLARPDRTPEALPPDLKTALLVLQRVLAAAAPPAEAAAPPQRVPPPVRGATLTPQAPVAATLPPNASLAAIVQHLGPQVEQAVARTVLHQLASAPDSPTTAWVFELPIATPQGAGLAQFQIERDSPGPGASDSAPSWGVRFAIDIEPLGPVHVHLRTEGERVAVTIWAERHDGLDRLRGEGAELARALPADVTFRLGAPQAAAPARGRFVDQTS